MGKITAVNVQKGDPTRVSVFVDGDFICGLYRSDAEKAGFVVGLELTAGEVDELLSAADADKAYRYSLMFLAVRPRSVAEVDRRLYTKGFSRATIASVVERLTDEGYLDDPEFARAWIRDRLALKPKGKRALIAELIAKGVARPIAETALEETLTEDEEELARRALLSFETRLERESPLNAKKKAYEFLARRGFPLDLAAKLSREVGERVFEGAAKDDS
jgi:regulatory protein